MMDWQRLTGLLLEASGDQVAAQGHPVWVRVMDSPEGDDEEHFSVALSMEPDALLGWVATSDCRAVGVIATGRLRALDEVPAGVVDPTDAPIRMACLMTRTGGIAWKMVLSDGVTIDEPPSEGRMLDCLRRCFGIPTPRPPASPSRLQTVAWLAAVLEQAQGARRPLSWSEVSRLHPVARVLGDELGAHGSDLLAGLVRMAGSAWSWEDFRLQAKQEGCLEEIIDAELAGWMDDGMFARWVLADLPSPDEMMAAVRPQLSPSAARRLAHAVHAASSPEPAAAGWG